MSTHLRVKMLSLKMLGAIAGAVLVIGATAAAQTPTPHVVAPLADVKWGPAPPMLPPGAQMAVLSGDPGKAAPFTLRVKFPAGYAVPAHSHPSDENVLVITGELFLGMGDKLNKSSATGLTPGGYVLMPAGMNHYAFAKAETTILVFGMGPLGFKYVNPADDPTMKK